MASKYLLSIKSGLSSQFVATGSTSVHSNMNMFTSLVISILAFHFTGGVLSFIFVTVFFCGYSPSNVLVAGI